MLVTLSIINIALIDKLEINFGDKLNILSGETGAGKSIIIDSLNFVLGERADKGLIRHTTDFATVEAVFSDYENDSIANYLNNFGFDMEEILIIKRKMTIEGKNECRINGKITTLTTLKGLTELLVDIHGQHEHQSLLKISNHIHMLNGFAGDIITALLCELKTQHSEYKNLKEEFNTYGNDDERERKIDILAYQIDEIEKANIYEGEEQELLEKRKKIRNIEKILTALTSAKSTLDGYDSNSVTANLRNSTVLLNSISTFDEQILELSSRLDDAKIEVGDIASTISEMLYQLNFDAKSADSIENRLELTRTLQRKYGGSYHNMQSFYSEASDELFRLNNATERVSELNSLIHKAGKALLNTAKIITDNRQSISIKFEKDITKELKDLGMNGTTFKVDIVSTDDLDKISTQGRDSVEFLISPNVGEPLKPLAKIISGGEMSRFMLALKNIIADIDNIGSMVFDEIDTGISGNISQVVSQKLCNISRKRQVLAITHLPSLASMADSHFYIEKTTVDNKTYTNTILLEDNTQEIARLIGGSGYSSHALPHATEMKSWANDYKKSLKN